uniref:Uncharacterized protein n=1 Tax=Octactis speculum TaxID=3111310 RepID=A0A7S2F4R0_9STRA|mmetsp:Transcript_14222/g.18954  ORF Transcript_14222/g.18954 Transcript_14222/m.18954 type:complete len:150 (+) Transcript_14222:254-703(+)
MGSNGDFDAMLEVINEHFRLDFEEKAATHKHGENSGVTHNAIVGDGLCQVKIAKLNVSPGQVVDSAELGKVCLPCGNAPEVIGRKQQSFCSGHVVSYSILLPTVVKKPLRFPELCGRGVVLGILRISLTMYNFGRRMDVIVCLVMDDSV